MEHPEPHHRFAKAWRRSLLTSVLVFVVLCVFVPRASAEYFVIDHFHADIEIRDDRSVHVIERIAVTFRSPRHGIYRTIPFKYTDASGERHVAPIDVKSVMDGQGDRIPYQTSREGNLVNIRIGDADRFVNGSQLYVIEYTVENILLFLDDRDELYWNVTGNEWPVPIDSVSAVVRLATSKKSEKFWSACYTGRSRAAEHYCIDELVGQEVLFKSTRGLAPREGFTVAVGFDKGILEPPTEIEEAIHDYNLTALWVVVIPLATFIFMFFHWRSKGRDPVVTDAVTVRYEPPKHNGKTLTAAEVGTMIDEQLDPRDLSASIVGLAAKGYLTIRHIDDTKLFGLINLTDYELTLLKDADESLTQFETYLLTKLFEGRGNQLQLSDLKNRFYKYIPTLNKTMYAGLTTRGYFASSPSHVRSMYFGAGIVVMVTGFLIGISLNQDDWLYMTIAGVISGAIILFFAKAMPAKTRVGAAILDHIRGFQEFMNRADKDRIERMGPTTFYEFLPYAIALDVTDQWAKAFDGLLSEPPNWYVGATGLHHFSTVAFISSLNGATSSLASVAYSSPRGGSGGSSGGGFSGGGGGGGGGGSW